MADGYGKSTALTGEGKMDKVTCPFCVGSKTIPFAGTKFRLCEDCGLFINTLVRSRSELKRTYKNRMLSTCFKKHPGENRIKLANKQLDALETYVSPGVVFDVGAAAGFFMKAAIDRGWIAHGNELSKKAIKWAKNTYNIDIEYGFLEELEVPKNHYDAVTLWQTLEHTPNPKRVLIAIKGMLKDEGLIFISLPNKQTIYDLKKHYTKDHPFEFTERCIERWLKIFGFQEIEKIKYTAGPPCADYLYRKVKK